MPEMLILIFQGGGEVTCSLREIANCDDLVLFLNLRCAKKSQGPPCGKPWL